MVGQGETRVNAAKDVIILGTSGTSLDILDTVNDVNSSSPTDLFNCCGFLEDNASRWGNEIYGLQVLGPLSSAKEFKDCHFVNGIGSSSNFWKKEAILAKTGVPLERFATIIHPTASVSRTAHLGFGTVVFQNVTITANARIGNHVVILPNAIISHDNVIGDFTCITGGVCISGGVRVGRLCYLGTNSSIIENVKIGDKCLIGMGSVVLKDVPENTVAAGNPARFLRPSVKEL